MKHYARINGKIWCNNFRCTPYRTRYIEQVARVPTPPRPVLPSPPRMGSLKIVFNRNGQWLVVIRGHYRVASRKRERGATHQPQSTSREREHRLSLCPFSLREREREREREASLLYSPLPWRLLRLHNRPGRHSHRRSSSERRMERKRAEPTSTTTVRTDTTRFVLWCIERAPWLSSSHRESETRIYSILYFPKVIIVSLRIRK